MKVPLDTNQPITIWIIRSNPRVSWRYKLANKSRDWVYSFIHSFVDTESLNKAKSTIGFIANNVDKHVDIIYNKANSALGFIRRDVNIGNAKVKTLAYKCYVRPVLE